MSDVMHRYAVFDTEAGFCAVAWSESGIARFQLPDKSATAAERHIQRRLPDAQPGTPPADVAAVIAAVQRYFTGEKIDFSNVAVDLTGQDDFFKRIYAATRAVDWGK